MADRPYVVVVGGANMDIAGRPSGPLVPHDSNLGTVRLSHGGVGRNIAHNLALLGVDVKLVTAFGTDAQAASLKAGCQEAGIDISHALTVPGGATSTYLFVMDAAGDMEVAINDMAILEEMTAARLADKLALMRGAAAVLVETNLPAETLRWLCAELAESGVPVFCDPISTVKAGKLEGLLGCLHTLKPNRLEAEALRQTLRWYQDQLTEASNTIAELSRRMEEEGDGMFDSDKVRWSARIEAAAREIVEIRQTIAANSDLWEKRIEEIQDNMVFGPAGDASSQAVGTWMDTLFRESGNPQTNQTSVSRVSPNASRSGRLSSAAGLAANDVADAKITVITENEVAIVLQTGTKEKPVPVSSYSL